MGDFIDSLEDYKIDCLGYAMILKLVEIRIDEDIKFTKVKLEEALKDLVRLKCEDGLFKGIRLNFAKNKVKDLEKDIIDKELWLKKWLHCSWKAAKDLKTQKFMESTIKELLCKFNEKKDNELKLYLIVQEAILTPVYGEFDDFPKGISEINPYHGSEIIAREAGMTEGYGRIILEETDDFLKGVNDYYSKLLKWTLAATGVALLTAGLAAPAIAGTIGGAMCLHGASAAAAGIAFLGGGAIVTSALGVTGGIAFVIGGGSIFGILGNREVSNVIKKVPEEVFSVSMAKVYNYVSYLTDIKGQSKAQAKEIKRRILKNFLALKHELEAEVLLEGCKDDEEKSVRIINIMNYTFDRLVDCFNKN